MKLTAKQEKFCQCIVKGMNQSDAYREAYDCSKTKDENIWCNASKLMSDTKVIQRIEELKQEVVECIKYTVDDSFKELNELLDMAKKTENVNAALKAVELKGKLANLYKEKEQNVNLSVNVMPAVKIDGSNLDLDIGAEGNDRTAADS